MCATLCSLNRCILFSVFYVLPSGVINDDDYPLCLETMLCFTLLSVAFLLNCLKRLESVIYCRMQFNFDLPSTILKKRRRDVFARKYRLCSNFFCTLVVNVV